MSSKRVAEEIIRVGHILNDEFAGRSTRTGQQALNDLMTLVAYAEAKLKKEDDGAFPNTVTPSP